MKRLAVLQIDSFAQLCLLSDARHVNNGTKSSEGKKYLRDSCAQIVWFECDFHWQEVKQLQLKKFSLNNARLSEALRFQLKIAFLYHIW